MLPFGLVLDFRREARDSWRQQNCLTIEPGKFLSSKNITLAQHGFARRQPNQIVLD